LNFNFCGLNALRMSLCEVAARFSEKSDLNTKLAADLWGLYDAYLKHLVGQPFTMLELGVHSGVSLKTFATVFPQARVIGVDIDECGTDFSDFPNIRFERGDQRDAERLAAICRAHAPDGVDVIIDDASHLGAYSLASYMALFPFWKPGGLYFVEDWATGYWTSWPDGGAFRETAADGSRVLSHDYGMVGFVKCLVDEVMGYGIRLGPDVPFTRPDRLSEMRVHKGMVVLRKA
jgi:hypothetical protein